ncbi:hypothetical protein MCOR14_012014, partial [Pyricularia oryzae]
RLQNEAATLQYIARNTNIPIPKLIGSFEDDGAVHLITEHVEGVQMNELDQDQRKKVEKEVEFHLQTLKKLCSAEWGGPSGIVIPPYRVITDTFRPRWNMQRRDSMDLVFCHNDLSTHNILVDKDTLKINAILDWEYAGFFPPQFEAEYFRRPGPSIALEDEDDDVKKLVGILQKCEAK